MLHDIYSLILTTFKFNWSYRITIIGKISQMIKLHVDDGFRWLHTVLPSVPTNMWRKHEKIIVCASVKDTVLQLYTFIETAGKRWMFLRLFFFCCIFLFLGLKISVTIFGNQFIIRFIVYWWRSINQFLTTKRNKYEIKIKCVSKNSKLH